MAERHVEYVALPLIQAAERNPKRHAAADIRTSIDRFGLGELPLIDERTGRLVAGHGRLDDIAERRRTGQSPPDGVRVGDGGEWLVPVVRGWASRSDAEAEAYLVASNKLTTKGGWDDEALADMLSDLADADLLGLTGFTEEELSALVAGGGAGGGQELAGGLNDPDEAPGAPDEPRSALGDVWRLGSHRVLCGDATDVAAVEALLGGAPADLVFTDPPYNADYSSRVDKARRKPWGGIRNDNMPTEAFDGFLADAHATLWALAKTGAGVYVWTDWKRYPQVARVFADAFTHKATIVWDKAHFGLGTYYRTQYELALFGVKGDAPPAAWNAGHDERDVWTVSRDPVGAYVHPTQKPVELAERAIRNSSHEGEVVLDPFGGSGSTLIAAHRTARIARLVELDPRYVDVICRRFQEHTGTKPVLEATGEPHDFTA